jgi:hypothetical protein
VSLVLKTLSPRVKHFDTDAPSLFLLPSAHDASGIFWRERHGVPDLSFPIDFGRLNSCFVIEDSAPSRQLSAQLLSADVVTFTRDSHSSLRLKMNVLILCK